MPVIAILIFPKIIATGTGLSPLNAEAASSPWLNEIWAAVQITAGVFQTIQVVLGLTVADNACLGVNPIFDFVDTAVSAPMSDTDSALEEALMDNSYALLSNNAFTSHPDPCRKEEFHRVRSAWDAEWLDRPVPPLFQKPQISNAGGSPEHPGRFIDDAANEDEDVTMNEPTPPPINPRWSIAASRSQISSSRISLINFPLPPKSLL